MTLSSIGTDLWSAETSASFPGGLRLPLRMIVVRLPSGELLLHSPIPLDDRLASEIEALGPVGHIVGPSLLHHLHLAPWHGRFPDAHLWGAPGLDRKRVDVPFTGVLDDQPPAPWRPVLEQVVLRGAPRLSEVVFFHRPTATLFCADLLFNVRRPENLPTRLILLLMGTHGRLAMSRLWRLSTKDRGALRTSLERVVAWPVARIAPAHGEIVEQEASAQLRRALAPSLRA